MMVYHAGIDQEKASPFPICVGFKHPSQMFLSSHSSNHNQVPLQVNNQDIDIVHVVYIPKVAAEIVFAFNKVTRCSLSVSTAIYRTSVARPRLVNIINMSAKIFGEVER
jgi:hypothetical protein